MPDACRVIYREEALDDLKSIPRNIQERIARAVEVRLQQEPTRYGTRLRRDLMGLWKMRVGDYRIVYEIAGRGLIRVWVIEHRRTAYKEALKRWARRH